MRLNPSLHGSYLREIVEQGGAPSIQILVVKAESLGGHGYLEESVAKRSYNSLTRIMTEKLGNHGTQELEIDPRKEALLNVQSSIRKGQIALAHAHLE